MPPRIQIIGNEDKAIPYIQWAKNQWKLREGTWYKHTGDCLIQLIRHGDYGFIRLIPEGVPRVVFTPRSGELQDTPFNYECNDSIVVEYTPAINGTGWLPQDEQFGFIPFLRNMIWPPTIGERTAVASDSVGDDAALEFVGELSNYGNLSWVSPLGDYAVSWKGTPARLLRDTCTKYDKTFTSNMYVAGEVIAGPSYPGSEDNYVIGAAMPDGVLYCVGYHRLGTGIKIALWKQDSKWTLLGDIESSYDGLPWFADNTGLNWMHPDGTKASVEVTGEAVTVTTTHPESGTGSQEERQASGGLPSFTKSYTGEYFFEYVNQSNDIDDEEYHQDEVVNATVTFEQSIKSEAENTGDTTDSTFRLEAVVAENTTGSIVGPENVSVGASYYVSGINGTYCDIAWSAPFSYEKNGNSITVTAVSSCGAGNITATLTGGGNDGETFTKKVKYPTGVWIQLEYIGAYEYCYDYGMPYYWVKTEGDIRKWYRVYAGVTYDGNSNCASPDIVDFDNGLSSGTLYGPKWSTPGWCNEGGGGYAGCGACVYGSYICYSASLMRVEQWVCP